MSREGRAGWSNLQDMATCLWGRKCAGESCLPGFSRQVYLEVKYRPWWKRQCSEDNKRFYTNGSTFFSLTGKKHYSLFTDEAHFGEYSEWHVSQVSEDRTLRKDRKRTKYLWCCG